jgi:putative ABC transport system substrate-binding protein
MKRTARLLLACVVFLSALWVDMAAAQTPTRIYRVAYLSGGSGQSRSSIAAFEEFKRALHDFGYAEGQNLVIDVRWTGSDVERLSAVAAEVVASKPDVIVAFTTPITAAAQRATSRIPIVMALVSDPVAAGFVSSLAHPGGNVTGITDYGVELAGKFVEQAHALAPADRPVAVLMAENPVHRVQLEQIEAAAGARRMRVLPFMGRSAEEIESAFASASKEGSKMAIVLGGPIPQSLRLRADEIVE